MSGHGADPADSTGSCGGVAAKAGGHQTMPEELMRATFDTNLFGPVNTIRAVLPGMRSAGNGAIVNISSVNAHIALPAGPMYAASKAALNAVSEALALEVAPFGIRVTVIEPGFIRTRIASSGQAASALRDDSPYHDVEQRMAAAIAAGVDGGDDPSLVAEAVWDAVTRPDPTFAIPVGTSAAGLIAARRATSDDDWLQGIRANYGLDSMPSSSATR